MKGFLWILITFAAFLFLSEYAQKRSEVPHAERQFLDETDVRKGNVAATGETTKQKDGNAGQTPRTHKESIETGGRSLFDTPVSFAREGHTPARSDIPEQEYVEIIASEKNRSPVMITGWTLKSAETGKRSVIGKGSYLPLAGRVNNDQDIFLTPGARAYIVTGRSPRGVSFRVNACTGYFTQFQDFTPPLPRECPHPKDEIMTKGPDTLSGACLDLIENIPRCSAYTKALPPSLSDDPLCQEYVSTQINYNECVDAHKNDEGFYKDEWRIYLQRDNELWKERREMILLLDNTGKRIDTVLY